MFHKPTPASIISQVLNPEPFAASPDAQQPGVVGWKGLENIPFCPNHNKFKVPPKTLQTWIVYKQLITSHIKNIHNFGDII